MKWLFKREKEDKIWWVDKGEEIGVWEFTFDKKKFYNLFRDYPEKLSVEEWLLFNEENPYWAKFFEKANEDYEMEHYEELKYEGRPHPATLLQ